MNKTEVDLSVPHYGGKVSLRYVEYPTYTYRRVWFWTIPAAIVRFGNSEDFKMGEDEVMFSPETDWQGVRITSPELVDMFTRFVKTGEHPAPLLDRLAEEFPAILDLIGWAQKEESV